MTRAAVDIGGTFTDVVTIEQSTGRLVQAKALTTYPDPTPGFLAALAKATDRDGLETVGYGTTLATNAVLTRSGAKTALLTTQGFRDVLEIRRTHRSTLFDIFEEIPAPIVPRPLRFEIPERTAADGSEVRALDEQAVRAAAGKIRQAGVESIAVSYLFSFMNPAHELRTRQILAEELPELSADITISSEALPLHREYERTSTTVMNAYLTPLVRSYFSRLRAELAESKLYVWLQMMQSNGGLVRPDRAASFPILTLLSGPAGGVMASAYLGRLLGETHLLTLDMGGTSCDVAGITDGEPDTRLDFEIGGYSVSYPTLDIHTVGAGGGSIAKVDGFGRVSVGPDSAGSDPGPACYGRGGEFPTVTDANLVLGVYDPDFQMGGEIYPDIDLAARAIEEHVGKPLGLSVVDAAVGIVRLVNANMMHALRTVSIERGRDPRDFALVPFGGAGPTHGVHIAEELALRRVVIPPIPGCNSALGILASDVRHDLVATLRARVARLDPSDLGETLSELASEARRELDEDSIPPQSRTLRASLDMRYAGQAYELNVPLSSLRPDASTLSRAMADFHHSHRTRYGHSLGDDLVDLVNVRLTGLGATPKPLLGGAAAASGEAEPRSRRRVVSVRGEAEMTPIYHREDLEPGQRVATPSVIQQLDSTTYLPFGEVRVHNTGAIVVDLP
ncbi:MAG: hydantoinase/oxoprolinase family protein [Acidimicrobiia bacterium]|nr:hydantoinase/oxoprolinase family protein [Acidimicrobiia bacterium]MYH05488.1 hydantoinase/oxoprolinase family protein [Acidimicrobiia bacterium]MYK55845.1 hydantoinase/oxoprolinase family protein [Acidimicrobiia bacterium]